MGSKTLLTPSELEKKANWLGSNNYAVLDDLQRARTQIENIKSKQKLTGDQNLSSRQLKPYHK